MKGRFILLLFLIFSSSKSIAQFSDFFEDKPKGNIHKITWVNYEAIKHEDTIIQGKVINYLVEFFDKNGNKIQREQRDSLNNTEWIYYFQFNTNNQCVKESWLTSKGQIKELTIREFINSNKYHERMFENGSILDLIRDVELNAENLIIEEKEYNKDSVLIKRRTYTYDNLKQKKSEKFESFEHKNIYIHKFESLNSLNSIEYVYKNDENDLDKKYERFYNKDKTKSTWIITSKFGVFKTEFNYKYDLVGNWIFRSVQDADRIQIVERKIEYK